MQSLSGDEWLFYGGIVVMALSVILAILCIVFFSIRKRRINGQLEREYGKPGY